MTIQWDTKKVVGLAALVVAFTQIGNGLKVASYLVGVPETAYAAKAQADKVDEQFERYLERQDAVAEALNGYVQQQQQFPNMAVPGLREWDETTQMMWCCPLSDRDACYAQDAWRRCL